MPDTVRISAADVIGDTVISAQKDAEIERLRAVESRMAGEIGEAWGEIERLRALCGDVASSLRGLADAFAMTSRPRDAVACNKLAKALEDGAKATSPPPAPSPSPTPEPGGSG